MVYKRLEGGRFQCPRPSDGVIGLSPAQFWPCSRAWAGGRFAQYGAVDRARPDEVDGGCDARPQCPHGGASRGSLLDGFHAVRHLNRPCRATAPYGGCQGGIGGRARRADRRRRGARDHRGGALASGADDCVSEARRLERVIGEERSGSSCPSIRGHRSHRGDARGSPGEGRCSRGEGSSGTARPANGACTIDSQLTVIVSFDYPWPVRFGQLCNWPRAGVSTHRRSSYWP